MIVPMKFLTLLCIASEREATLEKLRDLGIVHVNFGSAESDSFHNAEARLADAERALRVLADVQAEKPISAGSKGGSEIDEKRLNETLPVVDKKNLVASVLAAEEERQYLVSSAAKLDEKVARYAPYGDFDPELVAKLEKEGFTVKLFRAPAGTQAPRPDQAVYKMLGSDNKGVYGAAVIPNATRADFAFPEGFETVALPEQRISTWSQWSGQAMARARTLTDTLKTALPSVGEIKSAVQTLTDQAVFVKAADTMESQGAVSWITGWVPADAQEAVETAAHQEGWGVLLRDPKAGELPPTLLRPPKMFRPVVALFKGLGISPAYVENDVSVPFFCFFSIFFAMLVGDGAYGMIILGLTLFAWHKAGRKAPKSWFILLTCFAVATIIWGVLSNTWFGASIPWMANPVSRWLDSAPGGADENYHHIMLLCFTIGVAHLTIARVWNAILLFPDTKFLAEVGWTGVLWFMYCMTCSIVGIFPTVPKFIYPVMGVSVLLLFLFSLKPSELKTNGITLGMLPLNIVSTLGDIISYVRLFAVGLASVKVAQNFNNMAVGLNMPLWLKIIPMAIILLLGHGLNFAMAGLSILVHAVRLNTLEFSNHKGISWSGFAFKPFKKMM